MNAKQSEPNDYGDADIEELEGPAGSGRAAPIAIAVASVVVVAAVLAAWFFAIAPARRDAAEPATGAERSERVVQQETAPATPPAEQAAAQEPAAAPAAPEGEEAAEELAAAAPAEEAPAEASPTPGLPSFDMVRVESSGDAVVAGQAPPGADVTLFAGTDKIGEAKADGGGNWALVLDEPLPAGTSDLWISAAGKGIDETRSRQRLAIVIDPSRQARPLVVVQDDQGSRVLQQPELEVAEAAPAAETIPPADEAAGAAVAATAGSPIGEDTAEAPAETARSAVAIEAADYTVSGELHISGSAAPDATVRLYYDDAHAGDAIADASGRWSLSLRRELDGAVHSVRADDLDPQSGNVRTRAEVTFIARLSPEQERELSQRMAARAERETAAAGAQAEAGAGTSAVAAGKDPAADGVAAEEAAPAVARAEEEGRGEDVAPAEADAAPAAAEEPVPPPYRGRITIVRGDNLWRIAREHYGQGIRYTAIFQANQDQIRDPNLIYPGQVFLIPRLQDEN